LSLVKLFVVVDGLMSFCLIGCHLVKFTVIRLVLTNYCHFMNSHRLSLNGSRYRNDKASIRARRDSLSTHSKAARLVANLFA